MLLTVAALVVVVLVATAAYWRREPHPVRKAVVPLLIVATGACFSLWAAWLERPESEFVSAGEPVAIAIAFDVSPSMLAKPAPAGEDDIPARFERARSVIASVLDGLSADQARYLVSITGFAGDAGVLIGWHYDLAEVREALDYAVTPELFGASGTNFDKAAGSVVALFDMLPPRFDNARRMVLFVSDGESTGRVSDIRYAVRALEATGADVVALHVGMTERNEGIPVYNEYGEFRGFRVLNGKRYTRPDEEAMRAIANASDGLFVRAEDPRAAPRILELAIPKSEQITIEPDVFPLIGLFALTTLTLGLMLR